jgi:primosomal protein N'
VTFASKTYSAIVSAINVIPTTPSEKIKPIVCTEDDLEPVSEKMILLWRQISEYYMCTIGEVYKAAFPVRKIAAEEIKARIRARKQERTAKQLDTLNKKFEALNDRLLKKKDLLSRSIKDSVKQRYAEQIDDIGQQLLGIKEQKIPSPNHW